MSTTRKRRPLDAAMMESSQRQAIWVVQAHDGQAQARYDEITCEEPLEIRVHAVWQGQDESTWAPVGDGEAGEERTLSVTLRTPTVVPDDDAASEDAAEDIPATTRADYELALGYLFAEGLVSCRADVAALSSPARNVVVVTLRSGRRVPWRSVERVGVTSSACGLCGKRSLDALSAHRLASALQPVTATEQPALAARDIAALPEKLAAAQPIFSRTGGLHAAALFDWQGRLIAVREDIGRHNAVDKLIGSRLLAAVDAQAPLRLPAHILWVSGRAGYELVQKACMAGLPLFVAVGAPSSLAVQLAHEVGLSLVAFCREGQFNVYSVPERIALIPSQGPLPGERA